MIHKRSSNKVSINDKLKALEIQAKIEENIRNQNILNQGIFVEFQQRKNPTPEMIALQQLKQDLASVYNSSCNVTRKVIYDYMETSEQHHEYMIGILNNTKPNAKCKDASKITDIQRQRPDGWLSFIKDADLWDGRFFKTG